ncbi:Cytochrome P450, E-class, group I [Penicillium griseofulvum]|uniref:Cytochrome P450, E-class, group I n=1 Tax=Penicillium patulum TaxID=5078 RepID=A0A135LLN1_PENPA|nr:Cytochrome P450, E-class, group I [Penicillium griseofulvum]KXG49876.1 Cytochrome P450, E-class, group I [Penicillium griseofulvum]
MFTAVVLAVTLYLLYTAISAVWAIFLHPLHHIPGPKLWIAFPIIRYLSDLGGRLDADLRTFHDKYGEAVRFGPDEVSFITAQAWKDIYGHGHKQLSKVRSSVSNPMDIVGADDANHARYRKALSPAFSAQGLQTQGPVILEYLNKLTERLCDAAESQMPVDLVKWYNLTAFDLIGDLAFGESFGGLDSSQYHHWVLAIFNSIRLLGFVKLEDAYPLVYKALAPFIPKELMDSQTKQLDHSRATAQKRLQRQKTRGQADFMESMLRHRGGEDGLNDEELVANARILIIAGSETTATLLSGLTFWLLKTPEVLEKVTNEVRSVMLSEADITFNNVTASLPYMNACINEAFRMYPPVPTGLQRFTPSTPIEVSGYRIAPNTKVAVHQSAAYWSSINFYEPGRFIPDRWFPEAKNDSSSPFYHDNRDVVQPFSFGPRNCLGKNLAYNEMRLILARVLWKFDLELCEESQAWNDQKSYTLWDKPPLMCTLRTRAH